LRIFRRSGISPRQTCACRISLSKTMRVIMLLAQLLGLSRGFANR
jgi:hypothetical protein